MLDELRREIQDRLDEVLREADQLRRALEALSPGDDATVAGNGIGADSLRRPGRASGSPTTAASEPSAQRSAGPVAGSGTASTPAGAGSDDRSSSSPRLRTAPGAAKAAVLAALAGGRAMTAGEVAGATGLGRASVSTTLSKLAKSGVVHKAARGYQLTDPTI